MQKERHAGRKIFGLSSIFLLTLSIFSISFIISQSYSVLATVTNTPARTGGIGPNSGLEGDTTRGQSGINNQGQPGEEGLGIGGFVTGLFKGEIGAEIGIGALVAGAAWGLVMTGAVQLVGPLFGLSQDATNALSAAVFVGSVAGGGIASLVSAYGTPVLNAAGQVTGHTFLGLSSTAVGVLGGVAVAAIVFALMYKSEKKQVVQLQCLPWEAPLGGADCERCNTDPLRPCSEYRCKSFGQACELLNKGSAEERCAWVSPNDVKSPVMRPWNEPLTQGHTYQPDTTVRPPAIGVKILRTAASNGCIAPFTPLRFGIATDEPSQCKIDVVRPGNGSRGFDSMAFYMGGSNFYKYNHTETMRLPSIQSLADAAASTNDTEGGPVLQNDGTYTLFIRCRDANGNENADDFAVNFCVDPSPDTTPPVIESTSILNNAPIGFGVGNVSLNVNINEPAECRWSIQDKNYNDMENAMSCSNQIYQQNALQLYPCTTTLTGLQNRADNVFFFRCKDQPRRAENERNTNTQSYRFVLKGTQALNIMETGPNATVRGSSEVVTTTLSVRTANGAEEGKAMCYFSPSGAEGSFVAMFTTNTVVHNQTLQLAPGSYTYAFRCVDAGGNAAMQNVSFNVVSDRSAPHVTRIYREGPDALKVVTDEEAECVYSLNNCNFVFEDALRANLRFIYASASRNLHFIQWDPQKTYFIKCRDAYNNQPGPNSCSVIASASTVQ